MRTLLESLVTCVLGSAIGGTVASLASVGAAPALGVKWGVIGPASVIAALSAYMSTVTEQKLASKRVVSTYLSHLYAGIAIGSGALVVGEIMKPTKPVQPSPLAGYSRELADSEPDQYETALPYNLGYGTPYSLINPYLSREYV